MIQIQNLQKGFGLQELFRDASFQVAHGEGIGVTGRNGSGKSTLFKMILNQESIDGGSVNIPKGYTLGHLSQHLHFEHATVHAEACSALRPNEDGWLESHKVEAILFGLGFDRESMDRSPQLLSGGFQIRLNLAKVLASEPHMLLLDEPTNYLDIVSVRWLERFLRNWKGELLLITHDRNFMDRVCTHTVGIHRGRMRKIQGGVTKLQETLLAEEEVYMRTLENEAAKREQLQKFIDRFRAQATKAKAVQSRVKALERHEPLERLSNIRNLDFSFNEAPFPGKRVLTVQQLGFHYPQGSLLIDNISFEVFKGDRVAIIGPNGRGKTTLLNLIANELRPTSGKVDLNPNVKLNYFGQTNINRLDMNRTVEEEIQSALTDNARGRARTLAGVMMFESDAALKPIRVLSGGERSRVLLAKILGSPCNLLLLDEPTNHLDMESVDSLIDALEDFQGASMIVTHDEELLHAFATKLVVFDAGQCFVFEGTYQDFLERVGWNDEKNEKMSSLPPKVETPVGGAVPVGKDKESRRARAEYIAERSRLLKPVEKKITESESAIKKEEDRIAAIELELVEASSAGDGSRITELGKELGERQHRLERLLTEWENAGLALEELQARYPLE